MPFDKITYSETSFDVIWVCITNAFYSFGYRKWIIFIADCNKLFFLIFSQRTIQSVFYFLFFSDVANSLPKKRFWIVRQFHFPLIIIYCSSSQRDQIFFPLYPELSTRFDWFARFKNGD